MEDEPVSFMYVVSGRGSWTGMRRSTRLGAPRVRGPSGVGLQPGYLSWPQAAQLTRHGNVSDGGINNAGYAVDRHTGAQRAPQSSSRPGHDPSGLAGAPRV